MIKIERLNKLELVQYCKSIGLNTEEKTKKKLLEEIKQYQIQKITQVIEEGKGYDLLTEKINTLAKKYAINLNLKIEARKEEMKADDNSHYLIYKVLGVSLKEGRLIDEYQNTGRFLYKYAGSFLEEAASLCLKFKNINGGKKIIPNNQGQKPKTFEIDFLDDKNAIEIKWRDATTDGDHITKEHARVKSIESQGYIPIRVMFYYPQREQAIRIQETLKTIYKGLKGQYYGGEDAWQFIKNYTGYDLKEILTKIVQENTKEDEAK